MGRCGAGAAWGGVERLWWHDRAVGTGEESSGQGCWCGLVSAYVMWCVLTLTESRGRGDCARAEADPRNGNVRRPANVDDDGGGGDVVAIGEATPARLRRRPSTSLAAARTAGPSRPANADRDGPCGSPNAACALRHSHEPVPDQSDPKRLRVSTLGHSQRTEGPKSAS